MTVGFQVCTFYQRGNCSYGARCRYEHVKPSRVPKPLPPPPVVVPRPLPAAIPPAPAVKPSIVPLKDAWQHTPPALAVKPPR